MRQHLLQICSNSEEITACPPFFCVDRTVAPWELHSVAMVYRSTCKDAKPSKQALGYLAQKISFLQPAMSDLEEGEIEDGELPSTQPEVGTSIHSWKLEKCGMYSVVLCRVVSGVLAHASAQQHFTG